MKKIFTLLLALVLTSALGVNAQSLSLKSVAKKAPAKEVLATQFIKKPAHALKQAVTKTQKLKGEAKKIAMPATAGKVKKAEGDVVDYEIAPENVSCYYYSSDNDWYMTLRCDDGTRFTLDYVSDTFEGTFTLDDCLTDYTHFVDADYNYDNPTALELTVTGDLSMNFEITGKMVGESGTTYNFHAVQDKFITPTQTVTVNATCTAVSFEKDEDGDTYSVYQLQGDDNAMYQITLSGTTGEFATSDIAAESTVRMSAEGDIAQFNNGSATVEASQDYLLTCAASFVMSDAVQYNINWTYQIEPKETKDVVATNCKVDDDYFDWFGIYWYDGSNDDYQLVEAICAPESYTIEEQDFSSSECSFTLTDNDGVTTDLMIFNEAHQAIDEETGKPIITGTFLGDDLVKYNVSLSFVMPDEQGTKELTLTDLAFNNLLSSGAYQVYGYSSEDASKYASVTVYSDEVAGEFNTDDETIYLDYTYYADVDPETGDYTMVEFLKGNVTAEMDEDGKITMKTHLFGEDGYWYDMTITSQYEKAHLDYDAEDADVDVTYTADDVVDFEYNAENAYGYFSLENAERNDYFAMLIYSSATDDVTYVPEGTYPVTSTSEDGTVQSGEYYGGYVYPTFYCTTDEEGYVNTPLWFAVDGTVTIKNLNGELAFEVNAINSYDRTIHVVYNFDPAAIKDVDAAKSANVKKMIENKQVVIKKGDQMFNTIGQEVKF